MFPIDDITEICNNLYVNNIKLMYQIKIKVMILTCDFIALRFIVQHSTRYFWNKQVWDVVSLKFWKILWFNNLFGNDWCLYYG
jgi:hypothetical protein